MEIRRTDINNFNTTNEFIQRNNSSNKEINVEEGSVLKVPNTENEIKKVVETFNHMFEITQTHLKFSYHDKLGKYYVKVVDDKTNKVIREIPPEKLLDLIAKMQDFMGILFDKKV